MCVVRVELSGFHPAASRRRRSRRVQSPQETGGGLNEAGAESSLPDKFRQQFNAFKKGASRSRDEAR